MSWIDSHVHIWTPDTQRYPVAPGTDWDGRRPKDFSPEVLFRYARPSKVARFVLVQHQVYYGTDHSYMTDTVQRWPDVFRLVGYIDHRGGRVAREMAELKGMGVTGFRIVPEAGKTATWLHDEGYQTMFKAAAETGQAICPLLDVDGLGDLDRMCSEHPDTTVVIDHLARIGVNGSIDANDVDTLCSLAAHPRVYVKASAFNVLGDKKPPHDELMPLIRRVVEAFGPERVMWGSDSPYQVQNETYEDSIRLVRDRLDFLSEADRAQVLQGTAHSVFFD